MFPPRCGGRMDGACIHTMAFTGAYKKGKSSHEGGGNPLEKDS